MWLLVLTNPATCCTKMDWWAQSPPAIPGFARKYVLFSFPQKKTPKTKPKNSNYVSLSISVSSTNWGLTAPVTKVPVIQQSLPPQKELTGMRNVLPFKNMEILKKIIFFCHSQNFTITLSKGKSGKGTPKPSPSPQLWENTCNWNNSRFLDKYVPFVCCCKMALHIRATTATQNLQQTSWELFLSPPSRTGQTWICGNPLEPNGAARCSHGRHLAHSCRPRRCASTGRIA